jgi:Protein of unknown function (DUF2877)
VPGLPMGAAASSVLAPLFDGPRTSLRVISGTQVAWHLTTSAPGYQVVSLQRSRALVLPCSVVYDGDLDLNERGRAVIGDGKLVAGKQTVRPQRWWAAPRPRVANRRRFLGAVAQLPRVRSDEVQLGEVDLEHPERLIGRGPGLTPAGDDVLAGSLVLLNAFGMEPRPDWCGPAGLQSRTSALSATLLRSARDGYCVGALAALIDVLDRGADPTAALASLLAVGGTSGRAMLLGVQLAVAEGRYEAAA